MSTVLLCIDEDNTTTSRDATAFLFNTLAKDGDKIVAMTVLKNPGNPPSNHWDFSHGESPEAHNADGKKRAAATLKFYLEKLAAGKNFTIETIAEWEHDGDKASHQLRDKAKEIKATYVVVGHQSQRSFIEKLGSSVAKTLVDTAPCPVLTCKAHYDLSEPQSSAYTGSGVVEGGPL